MSEIFSVAFMTFFVVIDPIGIAPVFASLTADTSPHHQRKMAIKSVIIGTILLCIFAFGGKILFSSLGVSLNAFRAAGGIMLLMIALEMVFEKRTAKREKRVETIREGDAHSPSPEAEDISVFPMGIPMIAGPGSIAAVILLMSNHTSVYERSVVLAAMGLNLLITLVIFLLAARLMKLIGPTIAGMITRVLGVILAALSVQLFFEGIKGFFIGS